MVSSFKSKSLLQDRLAEAGGAAEVGFEGGFEPVGDAEAPLDFLHDAGLLGEGRQWYRHRSNVI